jgi:biopolymer transport protein ExbD
MAMQTGSAQATINMTPLIDVLLVLLIIFMILIPQRSVGLEAKVPQPAANAGPASPSSEIVVSIAADGNIRINTQAVSLSELGEQLQAIFARRAAKVLFLMATLRWNSGLSPM